MDKTTRIVIADAHLLLVQALSLVLESAGYEVAATVSTRAGIAVALTEEEPQLCLVESRFPDGVTSDVLGALVAEHPTCRFVVLSADHDPEQMLSLLNDGARGYVHKTRGITGLLDALRRVSLGETVIEGTFIGPTNQATSGTSQVRKLAKFLTQRELECLGLLVDGFDTAAISDYLGVSRTTVRSHVQAVLAKLGVHSRLEAAAVAVRHGLITTSPAIDLQSAGRRGA